MLSFFIFEACPSNKLQIYWPVPTFFFLSSHLLSVLSLLLINLSHKIGTVASCFAFSANCRVGIVKKGREFVQALSDLDITGPTFHKRNVLLVVAHPDDESMFFSPTISYLTSRGHNLCLLCLSVGNADGMGSIRKDELYRACAVHKVQIQQVKVLDHSDLQDGFGQVWNHDLLAKIIKEEVYSHGIDVLITFDSYGVSGHCNHRDVHYGVRKFLHDSSLRNIEAWELVSINILRKYSGPLDIWLSNLDSMQHPSGVMHCLPNEHPQKSFLAMAQHSSQWVWFRKLFISFSSYTYINTLRKIK